MNNWSEPDWRLVGGFVHMIHDNMALTFMATYHPSTLYKMKFIWTSLKNIREVDRSGAFYETSVLPKWSKWWQKDRVDVVTIRRVSMLIASQMRYSHLHKFMSSNFSLCTITRVQNSEERTLNPLMTIYAATSIHILQEWRFACSWRWWRWYWWSGDVSKKCLGWHSMSWIWWCRWLVVAKKSSPTEF